MADHGAAHVRGEMDISQHISTFKLFNGMTKWGSLATAALLLFLTLWFCTNAGFVGAAVSAAVLTVVGVILLRESPGSH